jgi:hypothetical protein
MMRYRAMVAIVFVGLCGATEVAFSIGNGLLSGVWTSQYQCPNGQSYPLVVRIDQQGQQLSAVKVTGDSCLASGVLAFNGSVYGNGGRLSCGAVYDPNQGASNQSGSVGQQILLGVLQGIADQPVAPTQYAIRYVPGRLNIISAHAIQACTLHFVRTNAVTPSYGAIAPPLPPQGPNPYVPLVPTYGQPVNQISPGYAQAPPNYRLHQSLTALAKHLNAIPRASRTFGQNFDGIPLSSDSASVDFGYNMLVVNLKFGGQVPRMTSQNSAGWMYRIAPQFCVKNDPNSVTALGGRIRLMMSDSVGQLAGWFDVTQQDCSRL